MPLPLPWSRVRAGSGGTPASAAHTRRPALHRHLNASERERGLADMLLCVLPCRFRYGHSKQIVHTFAEVVRASSARLSLPSPTRQVEDTGTGDPLFGWCAARCRALGHWLREAVFLRAQWWCDSVSGRGG